VACGALERPFDRSLHSDIIAMILGTLSTESIVSTVPLSVVSSTDVAAKIMHHWFRYGRGEFDQAVEKIDWKSFGYANHTGRCIVRMPV